MCTRAPPALSTPTRTAVSAVTCRQQPMVNPANGCSCANVERSMPSTGIARPAHAIPGWPARASPGSLMSDRGSLPAARRSVPPIGPAPDCRFWPARPSVPVVVRLERAIDWDAYVIGLLLGQLGEPDAERVQMQPCDLFVQELGQHVHADRVLVCLGEQFDLCDHLVGEAVRHHEARMARGVTQVEQPAL